jgi:hypothetical protein
MVGRTQDELVARLPCVQWTISAMRRLDWIRLSFYGIALAACVAVAFAINAIR